MRILSYHLLVNIQIVYSLCKRVKMLELNFMKFGDDEYYHY